MFGGPRVTCIGHQQGCKFFVAIAGFAKFTKLI